MVKKMKTRDYIRGYKEGLSAGRHGSRHTDGFIGYDNYTVSVTYLDGRTEQLGVIESKNVFTAAQDTRNEVSQPDDLMALTVTRN